MDRRDFMVAAVGSGIAAATSSLPAAAQTLDTLPPTNSGYLPVNGLEMYHEVYGSGGVPLVLIHGAFSAIGTSFGALLPHFARDRKIVALEMQGHGRTADIDRPLSIEAMASDVIAALDVLAIEQADLFGYSMGASIALQATLDAPQRVRKLVHMSSAFSRSGFQPGLMEGLSQMTPDMMHGTTFYEEYRRIAPRPDDFERLFEKKTAMDHAMPDVPEERIRSITAPVLLLAGDSDLPTVDHMAEFHRLLGGGRFGDTPQGLPKSQQAILPGTSHISIAHRADLVPPIVSGFLKQA